MMDRESLEMYTLLDAEFEKEIDKNITDQNERDQIKMKIFKETMIGTLKKFSIFDALNQDILGECKTDVTDDYKEFLEMKRSIKNIN